MWGSNPLPAHWPVTNGTEAGFVTWPTWVRLPAPALEKPGYLLKRSGEMKKSVGWIFGLLFLLLACWSLSSAGIGPMDNGQYSGQWVSSNQDGRFAAVYVDSTGSKSVPVLAVSSQKGVGHNLAFFLNSDDRPTMQIIDPETKMVYMVDMVKLAIHLASSPEGIATGSKYK